MKRKHKKAKIVLITLGSLVIITSVTVLGLFAYSWNYKIPVQAEKIEPTGTNLISTQNRSLYDKNGNIIQSLEEYDNQFNQSKHSGKRM